MPVKYTILQENTYWDLRKNPPCANLAGEARST